tara:strand:+ start:125 stop:322 length:198 start_codon:yes stop_codon:yes gene_type:complete
MANYEIRFKCNVKPDDYITTEVVNDSTLIEVSMFIENDYYDIILDKSTAIKFAKTLRTEINKIQD